MKHFFIFLTVSLSGLSLFFSFDGNYPNSQRNSPATFKYTLSQPEKTYIFPAILNEVSGIAVINQNIIACVQDEIETIFVYDLKKETLIKEYSSTIKGDYEELALVGNTMYLLRSDGVLVERTDYAGSSAKTKEYQLNLPSPNNEGLCFDKKNNRLLVAAKSKTAKGIEDKAIRLIYGFDLDSKTLISEPIFKLDIYKIEAKALAMHILIPTRTIKKTGKEVSNFNFRPSAIAIHPFENSIYILSASDKLLLIIDEKGNIINLFALNPKLFNKAEGITFLPDGDMLISNEAQKEKPTLLRFRYRK